MKLYHVGAVEIPQPDLARGRRNADFGQGFYLTPDMEFAERWAVGGAVLNCYELDTQGLQICRFTRSHEWRDYIFACRRMEAGDEADVIIGPIANDTLFNTMGIIGSPYLTPDENLQLLLVGPEYLQAAVRTDRALRKLRWLGAKRITSDRGSLEAEEAQYMDTLAAVMDRIGRKREEREMNLPAE